MELHTLKPAPGSTKARKRIGRGTGSGRGGTSTRGHKGAKSRSGYSAKKGFEGGQMPLVRRIPKFGFTNVNRLEYKAINLDTLQELSEKFNATAIDPAFLQLHGLVGKRDRVKILCRGELTASLEIKAHAFSATALAAIEKAGGKTSTV